MAWLLRIVQGPDCGRIIRVENGQRLVLGRADSASAGGADCQVIDSSCEVRAEGRRLWMSGASGAMLNGHKISRDQAVHPGDVIRVGDQYLVLARADAQAVDDTQIMSAESTKTTTGGTRTDRYLSRIESEARRSWVTLICNRRIGPFQVIEEIGRDEIGVTFRATDTEKNRPVRFKVLWQKVATDETAYARFVRAMRTTIDLKHPNVVRVYAAGKSAEICYMASELVEGQTLAERIAQSPGQGIHWNQTLTIARDITRALELASERNIVHRDIKPSNIVLTRDGVAKLDNLILAKAIAGTRVEEISVKGSGELLGLADLAFMSPEHMLAEEVDCRSDIYSLGASLYAALTSRPPFEAPSLIALGRQIQESEPIPPSTFQPGVPPNFDRIVLRMLAKKPAERYANPTALQSDLATIAS